MSETSTKTAADPALTMVVTLKNGAQIKADVETFTVETNKITGELKNLKWVATDEPRYTINWFDLSEVVAVHAEYDRSERLPLVASVDSTGEEQQP